MRLQRQGQRAVIFHHMFAERHRRQMRVGFEFVQLRMAPEREIVLVAGAVEAAHGPQRLAPIKADGAKRVRRRQQFKHRRRQARAQPDVADGIVAATAPHGEKLHVLLAHALHHAQPQRSAWVE